jgi:hypothetical protein
LFSVFTNGAFSLIVIFLLVVLAATNVINQIVDVSIAGMVSRPSLDCPFKICEELKNGDTGASTHVDYIIVRQLATGTKFLEFYVLYSKETEGICESLTNLYQNALNDFLEGRVEAEKIPGDSEVTTSSDLVFSNRIFIYHETYLSPEQVIAGRDTFKKKRRTAILRSTDYLSKQGPATCRLQIPAGVQSHDAALVAD